MGIYIDKFRKVVDVLCFYGGRILFLEGKMAEAEKAKRKELGEFMSSVCFKAAIVGMEEALGESTAAVAMIAAGRQGGKRLAQSLDLVEKGANFPVEELEQILRDALGVKGTRLCIVDRIERIDDGYRVYARETVCSAGEEEGAPRNCSYTMGAVQGFLEACLGVKLRGKHTDSVLRGSDHDLLEFIYRD